MYGCKTQIGLFRSQPRVVVDVGTPLGIPVRFFISTVLGQLGTPTKIIAKEDYALRHTLSAFSHINISTTNL